jgi:Icc-related predicted phosphoesterase
MRLRRRSEGASGGAPRRTRLFFTTDVHGSDVCFRKFVNAARAYEADVLVLGGDITGKQLVPLVRQGDGTIEARFGGELHRVEGESAVKDVLVTLADAGHYGIVCDRGEVDRLREDPEYRASIFERELLARLERWLAIADERLAGSGIRCLIQGGNDDFDACTELISQAEHVECPEDRVLVMDDGREIISCGRANMTPWACPRDVPEQRLEEMIESMASRLSRPETAIFNLHCPPVDTPLDEAPALGEDLKPKVGPAGIELAHVGSTSVRTAIERHQPLVSLHGHIHECRASVRIGRTLFNPGSSYSEGILHGALMDIADEGVRDFVLVTG